MLANATPAETWRSHPPMRPLPHPPRQLQPGDTIYLPDGTIRCLNEGGEKSAYLALRFARLDLEWLMEPANK